MIIFPVISHQPHHLSLSRALVKRVAHADLMHTPLMHAQLKQFGTQEAFYTRRRSNLCQLAIAGPIWAQGGAPVRPASPVTAVGSV